MQALSNKTTAILATLMFLGLVSRDLNAHHQTVSLQSAPQKSRTFATVANDFFYAEPTLTIRKLE